MGNRDVVRSHYNQHANANPSFDRAIANRQQGKAAALKDFHNHVKRQMIKAFASNAPRLLDLCCGRGGDIIKWFNFGVRQVKGIDISEGEVQEAARRFEEQKSKPAYSNKPLDAKFEVCDWLGEREWMDDEQSDVVTCMFAMHYFFEDEVGLKMFLHNVSLNLKPGGIFMGTIPCGQRVQLLLKDKEVFSSAMLTLEKKWQGTVTGMFGNAYTCAIADTVTEGKGDSSGSSEYLTFMRAVERILRPHGIFAVRRYADSELNGCFDPADIDDAVLKHCLPAFPEASRSLEAASGMFGTFVFRKSTKSPPPARMLPDLPTSLECRKWKQGNDQRAALRQTPNETLETSVKAGQASGAEGNARSKRKLGELSEPDDNAKKSRAEQPGQGSKD